MNDEIAKNWDETTYFDDENEKWGLRSWVEYLAACDVFHAM